MTPEALSKLTPQQKRVRIAELCGWRNIKPCACSAGIPRGLRPGCIHEENDEHLPEFLDCLNAMHEAEATLNSEQIFAYAEHLQEITQAEWTDDPREVFLIAHATAAQRADAFLLAVGEESQPAPTAP